MSNVQSFPSARDRSEPTRFSTQTDLHPGEDIVDYIKSYASQKPEVAAMWCFGIGFILGWKLKPW